MNTSSCYESLETFLAHAVTLEREAVEHLDDVAQMMFEHNNMPLYELFKELAGHGMTHASEIEALVLDYQLPALKPWEYQWQDNESPEVGDTDQLHYLMTPRQALKFALSHETSARDFYLDVATHTKTDKIKKLAMEFADEEAEHVQLLEDKLADTAHAGDDWHLDLDPPHLPE